MYLEDNGKLACVVSTIFNVLSNLMKTNLQDLNTASPTPFSNDILHNFNSFIEGNDIALKAETAEYRSDIPMSKIVGIHQGYGGASWSSCLEGCWLKRLDANLQKLIDNPNYYLSEEPKVEMSFVKVGEHYFIHAAKHRTIIARFFAHFNPEVFNGKTPLQNVLVVEHFIDKEFYQLKARVERLCEHFPHLTFKVEHLTDKDEGGFLKVSSSINNFEFYSRAEVYSVLSILEHPRLRDKLNMPNEGGSIYKFLSLKFVLRSKLSTLLERFS